MVFQDDPDDFGQSLALRLKRKDPSGEAVSLSLLGYLYGDMGCWLQAAECFRQVADIGAALQDPATEGRARSNLGATLIWLKDYGRARHELERAISCDKALGDSAQPWKTWAILHDLEREVGEPEAAMWAYVRARAAFLAYRGQGGESHRIGASLALVGQGLRDGDTGHVAYILDQLRQADGEPDGMQLLVEKLQAVAAGARDLALADDPALSYADAVELQILLEQLTINNEQEEM